jgi:hypothetical protein
MKKVLTIVTLLVGVATPAFAQSYSSGFGTGNVINEPALEQRAMRADAGSAFAQVPGAIHRNATIGTNGPVGNGGGSVGYNWNLSHNY